MRRYPVRREVIVVPCGGAKVAHAAPARDLYTGSAFREVLAAAIAEVGEENVLILSALYGLLELDEVVEPYDVKMGGPAAIDRDDFGLMLLASQVLDHGLAEDDVDLMAMLPAAYLAVLDKVVRDMGGLPVLPVYEGTLGIGDQKGIAKVLRTRNADLLAEVES